MNEVTFVCRRCRKKFIEVPIYTHKSEKPYCSEECLPQTILDQYAAWDYVDYVYALRAYIEDASKAKTKWDKRDICNDMELTMDHMGSYVLSSNENDYVQFIKNLFEQYNKLYEALDW